MDINRTAESRSSPCKDEVNNNSSSDTSMAYNDKSCRGLRLYGKLVLDKLKQKGTTNFEEIVSEVHEELVKAGMCPTGNDKSTRRRVYDVLNVLSAVRMISKDGKTIQWVNKQPCDAPQDQIHLEKVKKDVEESIQRKKSQLKDLLLQIISYKSLLVSKKNKTIQTGQEKIHLPFIVVKADKNTNMTCTVSTDKFQNLFTFDQPFVIQEDIEVLQRMGLAFGLENRNCSIEQLEVCKSLVTKQ